MDILDAVKERFFLYIEVDTQSAYESDTYPTTVKQLILADLLEDECKTIGMQGVSQDEYGYVYAFLPSNLKTEAPAIGLVAHMDTSPDCSGEGVRPQITWNYDGGDIELGCGRTLSPSEFPSLNAYIGQDIITAGGDTLLGADNKAGIAEILTAMEYLIENPEIPHGKICVGFTPDEEVGQGVDRFNLWKFGAAFGYTVDGGPIGELAAENFNAARATITVTGKGVHPGTAKGVMVNASLIAAEFIGRMPQNETPATTEGYEGYYHLSRLEGGVESAKAVYILRDFSIDGLNARKALVVKTVFELNKKYAGALSLDMYDEYYNMAVPLADLGCVTDIAYKAMEDAGVKPERVALRGGTDGARLSYMGLPCPNIFTGGHNFHGPYEYIPWQSMGKAVEVIVNICKSE